MKKEEQYFYHVVTEKPMSLGQVIIFDKDNHNGVYERSLNVDFRNSNKKTALEIVRENINDGKLNLNEEDTDILINYLEWSIKGYRELILEIERRRENIDAPSRMSCLYVSRSLEDARKWAKSFIYFGRPTFQIVKLRAIGNSFDGNSYNIKTEAVSIKDQFKFAKNYWNNEPCENELIETIIDGKIEVVEIIEEFNSQN
ncbi:DUF2441 domain-containing protein [Clostridium perfringens]|uniref:DUF2441 domain-containing protein n=1 Tax=Clostridium perfringens TaxID=1502 RepID=UPI0013E2DE77|nr:DUF2441 domain-containing protein [Clostridium perfringens]NGT33402.1 DUF2441 domain-containing protein [Clostridium perfringens]NGU11122.1 DUF2441 domain-containing protein [Clostridium perfringens]